jgi:hypothetical protein
VSRVWHCLRYRHAGQGQDGLRQLPARYFRVQKNQGGAMSREAVDYQRHRRWVKHFLNYCEGWQHVGLAARMGRSEDGDADVRSCEAGVVARMAPAIAAP